MLLHQHEFDYRTLPERLLIQVGWGKAALQPMKRMPKRQRQCIAVNAMHGILRLQHKQDASY